MTSSPGTLRRQKRMGPAPFASFEDLSDEQGSPEEKTLEGCVVRLPGIREDLTPATTPAMMERAPVSPAYSHKGISIIGATTTPVGFAHPPDTPPKMTIRPPATPRIDISRASSSSHHDSRDSSSEREIFDSQDKHSAKLGLGFREDGALELRSSTEELDFQEIPERRRSKGRSQSPSMQEENNHSRKGSQCSDIVLLSISGRTSRLSSIGSQGSGQSRLSNVSHTSDMSGQSGISRASSPHKMLLETSFCGTKPSERAKSEADRNGTKVEVMEKILLSRQHDPTQAILAEGIHVVKSESAKLSAKPTPIKPDENHKQIKCDVTITLDKPTTESNNIKRPTSRIVADSGVEYIYIPLKGPLPLDLETSKNSITFAKHQKLREVKSLNYNKTRSATSNRSKNVEPETRCRSASSTPTPSVRKQEDAKYIRIRLKPDRCYSDEASEENKEVPKPNLDLDLDKIQTTTEFFREMEETRSARAKKSVEAETNSVNSKIPAETGSPSPSVSRRSSFASLFKGKGALSPESPSVVGDKRKGTLTGVLKEVSDNLRSRSRSRSKSRDRDSHKSSQSPAPSSTESIDSKSKHKSVLSLFKSSKRDRGKSESENSSQENVPIVEGIGKIEFKFNERKSHYENPLESASIRIPLHSPTYYENRTIQDWKTSSQDSQETVIEAPTKRTDAVVESAEKIEPMAVKENSRQDSTTSENVVFSTKLGSNEVFTTKLPKKMSSQDKEGANINGIESINSQIEKLTSDLNKPENTSELKLQTGINGDKERGRIEHTDANKALPENSSQDSNESAKDQKTTSDPAGTKQNRQSQISVDEPISNGNASAGAHPDEEQNSSGSEREPPELAKLKNDVNLRLDVLEPERKAIVLQQDSFEDELPYIPTTLPLERSAAVPIVPVKNRSSYEVKTFSIERPKSTTPMNPNCLEEYCEVKGPSSLEEDRRSVDKIKISLPRNDSFDKTKARKGSNTNWTDFAERGISRSAHNDTPPPLPPKAVQKAWVNVNNIPEKRKAPKRIQTIPSLGHIEVPESVLQDSVIYNYVNPEECKCECHETTGRDKEKRAKELPVREDELPLLVDVNTEEEKTGPDLNDRIKLLDASECSRSIISDSSVDLSMSNDFHEAVITETTLHTPFTGDLGLTSNRSSTVSQDEHHSPDLPNAFPKTS